MSIPAKENGKVVLKIPFKAVAITAYAILTIPILIFFAGWLRWYLAAVFSGILLFGLYHMIKTDYWDNKDRIEIPLSIFIAAAAAFTFWALISGSNFLSVKNYDTPWRTAMLRDLTFGEWPINYSFSNAYLSYYFVFWLVPALTGKIFQSMTAAFIAQTVWFILILMTVFLLIACLFKDSKKRTLITIVVFMIMWSGINILGKSLFYLLGFNDILPNISINEFYFNAPGCTEPYSFHYRSNEDFICQCYNQLPIWIAVPLMLLNKKVRNFAFIGLLLFPFSPWGTVGIALIMIVEAVRFTIRERSFKRVAVEIFSIPNICAVFSVFLVFALFFKTGARLDGSTALNGMTFGVLDLSKMTVQMWLGVPIFWLCEFGIYYIVTWKKFRKDPLYVSVLFMLMIMPFFWVGNSSGRDFCMDATLPQLYVLMIYMIRYFKEEFFDKAVRRPLALNDRVLILAVVLAFTSPVFDWINKISAMTLNKSFSVQRDIFYTYSNKKMKELGNFAAEYNENAVFFKYLVKPSVPTDEKIFVSAELAEICSITEIDTYFDYLAEKNCLVYIAAQEFRGEFLTPQTTDKLKALGFGDDIGLLPQEESGTFIGIVNDGHVIALKQSSGDIAYEYEADDYPYDIESYTVRAESTLSDGSAVEIKGKDRSVGGRGLNVVVMDGITGCVVDSVVFDTEIEGCPCTRS